MNKVCLISIYFGKIPNFIYDFFDSCSWNKDFDFLFVTDQELQYKRAENLRILHFSLSSIQEKICKEISLNIPRFDAYKLCDFRPAFGEIFSEYLKYYEFWGYCDSDIILGKLNHFITPDILRSYDKICTYGSFFLIRNNEACNKLYKVKTKNSRDYEVVFCDKRSCIFDEVSGINEKFLDIGKKVYTKKVFADTFSFNGTRIFSPKWYFKLLQPKSINNQVEMDSNALCQKFVLDKSEIKCVVLKKGEVSTKEFAYIHKITYKNYTPINKNGRYILLSDKIDDGSVFLNLLETKQLCKKDFHSDEKLDLGAYTIFFVYSQIRLRLRNIRRSFQGNVWG